MDRGKIAKGNSIAGGLDNGSNYYFLTTTPSRQNGSYRPGKPPLDQQPIHYYLGVACALVDEGYVPYSRDAIIASNGFFC